MKSLTEPHEIKKAALRQSATGTLITFVLHPHEDNSDLIDAPIGAVFKATFELDEQG